MASLADLETDISDHERRATVKDKAAIGASIIRAIRHYSGRRWWWNENQGTAFNTVSGTEYYALPSPLRVIDNVSVTVSQDPYILERRTNGYIEEVYTPAGVYSGKPSDWCLFEDQIRIFPIPDGVYAVKVQGYGLALPTYSTDAADAWTTDTTTPWANDAYDLIYSRARALYAMNWRNDREGFVAHSTEEEKSLQALMAENNKRSASRRLRGWSVG